MRAGRAALLGALGLAALVAALVWVRWPGFTQGGFASHDVGGILYNAMLLRAGELPYVASIEVKAPGSFYLAALLAGPEGRDIAAFQVWANLWALGSLLGVGAIGWRLWGPRAGVLAAAIYGIGDAFLDSMDANYVTWAQLPQVLAVLAGVSAAKCAGRRRALVGWALAGALAGLAALAKQPAGIVLVVVAAWAAVAERGRGGRRVDRGALALVVAGFVAAHLPIAAHYLAHGHLGELVRGYALNPWGVRYLVRRAGIGALAGLREGALATAYFVGLPLYLALWTGIPRGERRAGSPLVWLWLWFGLTLAAAALGLRFYKGYFVTVAPALALLAAAPGGLLGGGPGLRRRWSLRAPALALGLVLALRSIWLTGQVREDRGRAHDRGGRILAEHIARGLAPGDRIWVWGWHLWDVYAFTGALSGSRLYKSLGFLTPPNDDTWRTPASRLTMASGSPYRALLIADLEASRPRVIALGSTVPREDFPELRRLLQAGYVRDRGVRVGRVEVWRRRDP